MADKLNLKDLPLATTPGGRAFALKALHPSEHSIKTARIPGGNRNSVAIACDMVTTIQLSDKGGGFVRVITGANPLIPGYIEVEDNGAWTRYNMFNAAFGGAVTSGTTPADTNEILKNMTGKINEYRISSQSVTAELIAPALQDQGTITAVQYARCPKTNSMGRMASDAFHFNPDAYLYPDPLPVSSTLLGTTAYTSKAREGCYMPLKLTSFKWRNMNDRAYVQNTTQELLDATDQQLIAFTNAVSFPYFEARGAVTEFEQLTPVPKWCGHNFGFVVFQGLGPNVSVRVRLRQVVEVTAPPGSVYAPMCEIALPPDETAIRMYQEISSRMADAYPASYNDLGKLKDIILGLGRKILPFVEPALGFLSTVPGPVGAVASVAKSVAPVVKNVIASRKQLTAKKQ